MSYIGLYTLLYLLAFQCQQWQIPRCYTSLYKTVQSSLCETSSKILVQLHILENGAVWLQTRWVLPKGCSHSLTSNIDHFMESARVRYLRTSYWRIRKRTSDRSKRVSFLIQKQRVRKYHTKHFPCCNLVILYILRFSPSTRCSPFRGKTNLKLCFYSACGTLLLLEKPSANIFCLKCLPRRQSAVFSCVGFVSLALLICKSFALSSKCEINNDTTDSFLDRI